MSSGKIHRRYIFILYINDSTWIFLFFSVCVDLVRRHAGVLGLSACILSSPYDVPTWMPQILMDLSAHLNDTQPIEVQLPLSFTCVLDVEGGRVGWSADCRLQGSKHWLSKDEMFKHFWELNMTYATAFWCTQRNVWMEEVDQLLRDYLQDLWQIYCCLSRWLWRKHCRISVALIMITGRNTSRSSQMTSCWCSQICWSPPVTTLRSVIYTHSHRLSSKT